MQRFHVVSAPILVLSALAVGCVETPAAPADTERCQAVVDSVVADNELIHSAALAAVSPSRAIDWQGAAGLADPAAGTAMTPATPVRIASNTKTFVAAATLRLAESGEIGLGDAIADRLPHDIVALLGSDGYDPGAITVRHLLTHTSGIFDHSSTGAYTDDILADPQRAWTARSQLEMAIEIGDPLAPPGAVFSYSDTGYIVLGMVLEHVTGESLAAVVRDQVGFGALGLDSTWWEVMEPEPDGVPERAHQFYGEIDSYSFHPSYDLYGGGGLVATVGDLATFFGGLFRGRVYTDPKTMDTMLTTFDGLTAPPGGSVSIEPGSYRMGLWEREVAGHTTWWHTGFFGTMAVHVPDLDLTIAATVNQNQGPNPFDGIVEEVIGIVEG